ncbi:hypothetical protein [Deinococcus humi]|uniref:Uncharacterized protein n=1 Tax=Deinococcus humi TaxID=662880 RepID=A0A7W8JW89_9DEIO|nr:hypothetical protein [Deinococcus humi]MBB5363093.1 hypothetical protein [Deinococcus humi]GGO24716.1 hypothetical protein GCM10008949_13930 [Deinococcus humi]
MSEWQLSDGTRVRVAPMAEGSTARPLDTAFKLMPAGTKADLKRGATDKTSRTFDSGMAEDGRVTGTNWGYDLAGNRTASAAFDAFYTILEDAHDTGAEVWCERNRLGETVWKGGRCSVMDLPEPVGADNIIDWSASLKGRGLRVDTPVTP